MNTNCAETRITSLSMRQLVLVYERRYYLTRCLILEVRDTGTQHSSVRLVGQITFQAEK